MSNTIPPMQDQIGHTRLVALQRLGQRRGSNQILLKLEGDNPAGSVKDRPALYMIRRAAERGDIEPGDCLVEATSGNTGIALAMAAAVMGYRLKLIMPENMSQERMQLMRAYGAELILVSKQQGMEGARDLAVKMAITGEAYLLNQFDNPDNPLAHYETTGPEIWQASGGRITHFVSSMGTTGTIMGVARYLKEQNPDIQIIGVQPDGESSIPGIRRWPADYMPAVYDPALVDAVYDISEAQAVEATREMARREGICAGVSSGGALSVALELEKSLENAVIVSIVCDRGDRYLSTGLFDEDDG
ncbi:cysteine synthase CysM [Granulosicoccaceae sp. 1_MG-2023]|nr:cysteine synthase CysM [Granulosicoccaceae sp. 1_MG-2023]